MKRHLALFVAGLCILFASCSKDETPDQEKWFGNPTPAVEGTTVTFRCTTDFGPGVLTPSNAGVAYTTLINGNIGNFVTASNVTVNGNVIECRLENLAPETSYLAYAYADLGNGLLQSPMSMFTTGKSGDTPPPGSELTFGTPGSSAVTANSAKVSCSFNYSGSETITKVYFVYASSGGSDQKVEVSVTAGTKNADLTGLQSSTSYSVGLRVEIGDKAYTSSRITFTTLASGGGTGGNTKFSGWAELPEESSASTMYYAYHMRSDASSRRNYSVAYSSEMNCPIWVAYPMHTSYTEGSAGGQNKDWRFDPVIPQFVQPDLSSSYKGTGDGSYSRGHMCASGDRQVTSSTNRQTFYYTNMAPQIQNGFNGGIWSSLEMWCRGSRIICSDTLYVVTGSYYANKNKRCEDNSNKTVYVPTHFYKALIRSKSGNTGKPLSQLPADQIQCVVMWFEHKVYSGGLSSSYMRSVADVEQQTGLKFFTNVPNAPKDTFKASDWGM